MVTNYPNGFWLFHGFLSVSLHSYPKKKWVTCSASALSGHPRYPNQYKKKYTALLSFIVARVSTLLFASSVLLDNALQKKHNVAPLASALRRKAMKH